MIDRTLITESGHSATVAEPLLDGLDVVGVVVAECVAEVVVEVVADGLELLGPGLPDPDAPGAAAPLSLLPRPPISHHRPTSSRSTTSSTSSRRSQ